MKHIASALIVAAAAIASAAGVSAQNPLTAGSPGIAIAGSVEQSQIPAAVTATVAKLYPDATIVRSVIEFEKQIYELTLSNGVEIDVTAKGKVKEIEAPKNKTLDLSVIKAVLPEKTVRHLTDKGYINMVDEIKAKGTKGYKVSLIQNTPDDIIYDIDGELIAIEY